MVADLKAQGQWPPKIVSAKAVSAPPKYDTAIKNGSSTSRRYQTTAEEVEEEIRGRVYEDDLDPMEVMVGIKDKSTDGSSDQSNNQADVKGNATDESTINEHHYIEPNDRKLNIEVRKGKGKAKDDGTIHEHPNTSSNEHSSNLNTNDNAKVIKKTVTFAEPDNANAASDDEGGDEDDERKPHLDIKGKGKAKSPYTYADEDEQEEKHQGHQNYSDDEDEEDDNRQLYNALLELRRQSLQKDREGESSSSGGGSSSGVQSSNIGGSSGGPHSSSTGGSPSRPQSSNGGGSSSGVHSSNIRGPFSRPHSSSTSGSSNTSSNSSSRAPQLGTLRTNKIVDDYRKLETVLYKFEKPNAEKKIGAEVQAEIAAEFAAKIAAAKLAAEEAEAERQAIDELDALQEDFPSLGLTDASLDPSIEDKLGCSLPLPNRQVLFQALDDLFESTFKDRLGAEETDENKINLVMDWGVNIHALAKLLIQLCDGSEALAAEFYVTLAKPWLEATIEDAVETDYLYPPLAAFNLDVELYHWANRRLRGVLVGEEESEDEGVKKKKLKSKKKKRRSKRR